MAKPKEKQQQKKSISIARDAVPAEVLQVMGRMGIKGVIQVRCKVIGGHDTGKILVRNIIGPTRKGDILMLRETEMEAAGKVGVRR